MPQQEIAQPCWEGRALYSKACAETRTPKLRVSAADQRIYQKAPSPGKAPAPSPACFMALEIWGMPLKGAERPIPRWSA